MKAIYKKPGEDAELIDVEDELEVFQHLVGGWIEPVLLPGGVIAIVNEEGRINGMELNMYFPGIQLFGPIVFVGEDPDDLENWTDCPMDLDEFEDCCGGCIYG